MKIPNIPHINKWKENVAISAVSDPSISPQTNDGCTVTQFNDILYVIFRNEKDNHLRYMTMDANGNWSGNKDIEVGGKELKTEEAPAAVEYKGKLYVAYRKKGSKDLCMTRFDGNTWSWGKSIKDISDKKINPKTNSNPAIAVFKNILYIAHSGSSASDMYILSYDGSKWAGDDKMKSSKGDQLRCDKGPALAVFNNLLYCSWQGNGTQKIYQATWDGSGNAKNNWQNYKAVEVSRGIKNTVRTNKYPTLVPFDGKLFMFHKGNHSDKIYQLFLKKDAWKEDLPISLLSNYDIESNKAVGEGTFTYKNDKGKDKTQIVLVYKGRSEYTMYQAKFY